MWIKHLFPELYNWSLNFFWSQDGIGLIFHTPLLLLLLPSFLAFLIESLFWHTLTHTRKQPFIIIDSTRKIASLCKFTILHYLFGLQVLHKSHYFCRLQADWHLAKGDTSVSSCHSCRSCERLGWWLRWDKVRQGWPLRDNSSFSPGVMSDDIKNYYQKEISYLYIFTQKNYTMFFGSERSLRSADVVGGSVCLSVFGSAPIMLYSSSEEFRRVPKR